MKFDLKILLHGWEKVLKKTPDIETLPQEQKDALMFMQLLIDELRAFDKTVLKTVQENTFFKAGLTAILRKVKQHHVGTFHECNCSCNIVESIAKKALEGAKS